MRFQPLYLIPLVLVLTVLSYSAVSQQHDRLTTQYNQAQTDHLRVAYQEIISGYARTAQVVFDEVINQPGILALYSGAYGASQAEQAALRAELYERLIGTYETLSSINLRQLHFHLPDNTSFLRFHRPERFGDDLTGVRYTVMAANTTRQTISGFEEGRIYNGFRHVYPLFYEGQHIGSVEISVSFAAIQQDLNALLTGGAIFMLKQSVIDAKVFSDEQGNYESSDLDAAYVYDRAVMDAYASEDLPLDSINALNDRLRAEAEPALATARPFTLVTTLDDTPYVVAFLPIDNFQGEHVGYVVLYREDDYLTTSQMNHLLTRASIAGIGLSLLLVVMLSERGTRRVVRQRDALEEANAALVRSEARFRQMFERNQAVKLLIDPADGRIVEANSGAVAFYGYTREQLLSMHIHEINMLPQAEVRSQMQAASREAQVVFKFQHRLADGSLRDVNVFSGPMELDGTTYLYSIILDVTAQCDAERARARSELKYRALFEQANDAVFILDLNGAHLMTNHRAAEMLGYSFEEINRLSSREIVVPDEHGQSQHVLQRLLAGEQIAPYERNFRRKDGSTIPVEINVELVRDEAGNPLHIQSVARDITDRKCHEKRAFQLALERERAALINDFITDVSHEFRTPLSVINTRLYLIGRLLADTPHVERGQQMLDGIEEQTRRIDGLVDSVLTMTRLDTEAELNTQPLSMSLFLREHAATVGERAARHDRQFSVDLPDDLPTIEADASKLNAALDAVFDNALRYTHAGGSVHLTAGVSDERIEIRISDDGVGISEDALPRVFDHFFRVDHAHSTPGFGLGLSVALKAIRLHGGEIKIGSGVISNGANGAAGQASGTRVCICLPLIPAPERTPVA